MYFKNGDIVLRLAGDGKRHIYDHLFISQNADIVVVEREGLLAVRFEE